MSGAASLRSPRLLLCRRLSPGGRGLSIWRFGKGSKRREGGIRAEAQRTKRKVDSRGGAEARRNSPGRQAVYRAKPRMARSIGGGFRTMSRHLRVSASPREPIPTPARLFERQQREGSKPVFAHIVAGDMRQAGVEVAAAAVCSAGCATGCSGPSAAAMARQHQARLRLRPSRCAILPSLRSETMAGVNRLAGRPWAAAGRKPSNQSANSLPCRTLLISNASVRAEERNSSPPGSHAWQSRSPANQSRARWSIRVTRAGLRVSAQWRANSSAKLMLKWVPTRSG